MTLLQYQLCLSYIKKLLRILNDGLSTEVHCISSSGILRSDDLHSSYSCGESMSLVNAFMP